MGAEHKREGASSVRTTVVPTGDVHEARFAELRLLLQVTAPFLYSNVTVYGGKYDPTQEVIAALRVM